MMKQNKNPTPIIQKAKHTPSLGGKIFANMQHDEIEELTHSALSRDFRQGEFIIQAGEQGHSLYIILSGKVKVLIPTRDGGAHKLLTFLEHGDCFGEIANVLQTKRSAGVIAVQDTKVLLISEKKALDFMTEHKQMMFNLLKYSLNRVYQLSLDSEISSLKSQEKVYYFLKWRLAQQDQQGRYCIKEDEFPSMQEIADYIGLHRSTVHDNFKLIIAQERITLENNTYFFNL